MWWIVLAVCCLIVAVGLDRAHERNEGHIWHETIFGVEIVVTRMDSLCWRPFQVPFRIRLELMRGHLWFKLSFHSRKRTWGMLSTTFYCGRQMDRNHERLSRLPRLWWSSEHVAAYLGKYVDNSERCHDNGGPTDYYQYSGVLGNHLLC